MLVGFAFTEERYHHQVVRVIQNSQQDRDEIQTIVGPVIESLDRQWSQLKLDKLRQQSMPTVKVKSKTTATAVTTPLWLANFSKSVGPGIKNPRYMY